MFWRTLAFVGNYFGVCRSDPGITRDATRFPALVEFFPVAFFMVSAERDALHIHIAIGVIESVSSSRKILRPWELL
jgi:hypothetical protein